MMHILLSLFILQYISNIYSISDCYSFHDFVVRPEKKHCSIISFQSFNLFVDHMFALSCDVLIALCFYATYYTVCRCCILLYGLFCIFEIVK